MPKQTMANAHRSLEVTPIPKLTSLYSPFLFLFLLLALSAALAWLVYRDYLAFLALGPGGTPSTPSGYVRIKFLSLFQLWRPCTPPGVPPSFRPQRGFLDADKIPMREGPRPTVKGIAPQRQTDQRPTPTVWEALRSVFASLKEQRRGLYLATSCFEKNGTGLFCENPVMRTCKGEAVHAHASDGSMHMTLHPADVGVVLAKGWGQRHPLARGGCCARFVPKGFVMVYAPRCDEELAVVRKIICAAVWWVGDVMITEEGEIRKDPILEEGLAHTQEWESSRRSEACPIRNTFVEKS